MLRVALLSARRNAEFFIPDRNRNGEHRLVRGARFVLFAVNDFAEPVLLNVLLQLTFVILRFRRNRSGDFFGFNAVFFRSEPRQQNALYEVSRFVQPAVGINPGNESLEKIFAGGFVVFGRISPLALAEKYVFVQTEPDYRLRKRFPRNYLLAITGENAFAFRRELCEKIFRDDEFQNSVAEKLEKFVVFSAVFVGIRRMSETSAEQRFVLKRVAEPLFAFVHNENHTLSPLILPIFSFILPLTFIAAALYAWNMAFFIASALDEPCAFTIILSIPRRTAPPFLL